MKKLINKFKRGFTIVELVIVIAVIAILAAVLIPTLSNVLNSAEESADMQTVYHLNQILSSYEVVGDGATDINEALEQAQENGYSVEKLTPTSDGDILWDSESNRFLLVSSSGEILYSDSATDVTISLTSLNSTLWKIVNKDSEVSTIYNCKYSSNYSVTSTAMTVTSAGVDVSSISTPVNLTYTSSGNTKETVNITGNGGSVTINDEDGEDDVNLYGTYSSVTATNVADESLHIFGTVTGTVTIDKGHVVIEAVSSVSSVYVTDTSNVKVTVLTTSTISIGYDGTGTLNVEGNTSSVEKVTVDSRTVGLFAGGLGTENSPYQIATAEQFTNINTISTNASTYGYSADNRVYYKLVNDIALSTGEAIENTGHYDVYAYCRRLFYAVLDGDGYTLDASYVNPNYVDSVTRTGDIYHYDVFYVMCNSDIKNVTINMGGQAEGIVVWAYETSSFTCVDVTGKIEFWYGNLAAYVGYAYNGNSTNYLTFTDCTNYATLTSGGDYYNSVFVGRVTDNYGGILTYLTFDNCENAGNFTGYKAAMFVANCNDYGYKGIQELIITDCKNTGTIRSTCTSDYTPNFYIAQGSMSGTLTVDGAECTLSTVPTLNNVYQGPNDTVSIYLDNGYYSLTASNISGASTYVISVGLYTQLSDGTSSYFVTLTVNASDFDEDGTYTSTLQNLQFMDLDTYKSKTGSEFSYTADTDTIKAVGDAGYMAKVDGVWYYIVNQSDQWLTNGIASATRITVSVRDESNYLLSSASMTTK